MNGKYNDLSITQVFHRFFRGHKKLWITKKALVYLQQMHLSGTLQACYLKKNFIKLFFFYKTFFFFYNTIFQNLNPFFIYKTRGFFSFNAFTIAKKKKKLNIGQPIYVKKNNIFLFNFISLDILKKYILSQINAHFFFFFKFFQKMLPLIFFLILNKKFFYYVVVQHRHQNDFILEPHYISHN